MATSAIMAQTGERGGGSSYGKIYNWLFFYNGSHTEHHFRPKVHWTKIENFHQRANHQSTEAGRCFRVINKYARAWGGGRGQPRDPSSTTPSQET